MRKWKRAGGCRSERPIRRRSAQSTIFSGSRSRNIAPVIQWRRCKVGSRKQEGESRKEKGGSRKRGRKTEVRSRKSDEAELRRQVRFRSQVQLGNEERERWRQFVFKRETQVTAVLRF